MKKPFVTIVVPALNEEESIGSVISDTLKSFEEFSIEGEIIVVNDGSWDKTGEITEAFSRKDARVRLINHLKPLGIGSSFYEGSFNAKGEYVTMLPGDHENIPDETIKLMNEVNGFDVIVPYVENRQVRGIFRRSVSRLFTMIVNTAFLTGFKYTNGTNIYRTELLQKLDIKSSGFFYQTEILVKLYMQGVRFRQLPYQISERTSGHNKAISLKSLGAVASDFFYLVAYKYLHIRHRKT